MKLWHVSLCVPVCSIGEGYVVGQNILDKKLFYEDDQDKDDKHGWITLDEVTQITKALLTRLPCHHACMLTE